jgi:NAD(P)-dependent dehydrogenase (short-subunit alcohol dehydrogenase family)
MESRRRRPAPQEENDKVTNADGALAGFPTHQQRFGLDGRTAFVSGAAGHLGRAMSLALAQAGAHVILNGRTRETLEALSGEMAAAGLSSSVSVFDVSDLDAAGAFLRGLDRLDVLVNNAITGLPGKGAAPGVDSFRKTMESGLLACSENINAAIPALEAAAREVGHASVINITSIFAHVSPTFSVYEGTPLMTPPQYGATKAGLIQLTRYMAVMLAPKKIRVNSLSPGIFPWEGTEELHPSYFARASEVSPMGRLGRPEELAGAAVFMASDAATFMTGTDLRIDGGWTAK